MAANKWDITAPSTTAQFEIIQEQNEISVKKAMKFEFSLGSLLSVHQ